MPWTQRVLRVPRLWAHNSPCVPMLRAQRVLRAPRLRAQRFLWAPRLYAGTFLRCQGPTHKITFGTKAPRRKCPSVPKLGATSSQCLLCAAVAPLALAWPERLKDIAGVKHRHEAGRHTPRHGTTRHNTHTHMHTHTCRALRNYNAHGGTHATNPTPRTKFPI